MTLIELIAGIGLDKNAAEAVFSIQKKLPPEFSDYGYFLKSDEKYFGAVTGFCEAEKIESDKVMLTVCCLLAAKAYAYYRAQNISDDVYFDTFRDIAIWNNTYFCNYKAAGLKEYRWIAHHLNLRLFRLGRLQFLPAAAGKDYCFSGKKVSAGDIVLTVHIPKGGALVYEECQKSYARACGFFHCGGVFFCDSWLLNDKLKLFLKPMSNIIRFQNDYTLFDTDENSRQGEERVFGKISDDFESYPESTSLQKGLKDYLQANKRFGTKTGIFSLF